MGGEQPWLASTHQHQPGCQHACGQSVTFAPSLEFTERHVGVHCVCGLAVSVALAGILGGSSSRVGLLLACQPPWRFCATTGARAQTCLKPSLSQSGSGLGATAAASCTPPLKKTGQGMPVAVAVMCRFPKIAVHLLCVCLCVEVHTSVVSSAGCGWFALAAAGVDFFHMHMRHARQTGQIQTPQLRV